MTKTELEEILRNNKFIENVRQPAPKNNELIREFYFEIRGKTYSIEWWCNIMYFECDEMTIPFGWLEITGTWPNHFKKNIQLYKNAPKDRFDHPDVVGIIPLEEYES